MLGGKRLQTFLPYPDFRRSAAVLDRQRLGKQRVEALQLLRARHGTSRWRHHPAYKMWEPYPIALGIYGLTACAEWIDRGYKDRLITEFSNELVRVREEPFSWPSLPVYPPWLGSRKFHLAHRSNLVRKMPEHYRQYWPDVPDDLEYIWPV